MNATEQLDKAIAAAREALTYYNCLAECSADYDPCAHKITGKLEDLLAALDAARGQAVVWVHQESEDIEYNKKPWMGAEWQPLFAAPPTAIVTLPYGWHLVPRHLPDEVLVDTGDLDGHDGQRGNAEHRAWWESAIDSLALRVPCPVLTYTPAPPAAVCKSTAKRVAALQARDAAQAPPAAADAEASALAGWLAKRGLVCADDMPMTLDEMLETLSNHEAELSKAPPAAAVSDAALDAAVKGWTLDGGIGLRDALRGAIERAMLAAERAGGAS